MQHKQFWLPPTIVALLLIVLLVGIEYLHSLIFWFFLNIIINVIIINNTDDIAMDDADVSISANNIPVEFDNEFDDDFMIFATNLLQLPETYFMPHYFPTS